MIIVDTSVWIAAQRQAILADVLRQLLEADEVAMPLPVRLELTAGIAFHQRKALKRQLSGLPQLYPTEETWKALPAWIERAADAGERFGFADLLIASLAAEIGGLVWSLDKSFERMERLNFVSLYSLPH